MAMPQHDDIETRELKVVMASRSLKVADLAARTGIGPRRITNLLAGNDPTWPIRASVNQALGRKIFAKPANARRRRVQPAPRPFEDRMLRSSSLITKPLNPHAPHESEPT